MTAWSKVYTIEREETNGFRTEFLVESGVHFAPNGRVGGAGQQSCVPFQDCVKLGGAFVPSPNPCFHEGFRHPLCHRELQLLALDGSH